MYNLVFSFRCTSPSHEDLICYPEQAEENDDGRRRYDHFSHLTRGLSCVGNAMSLQARKPCGKWVL